MIFDSMLSLIENGRKAKREMWPEDCYIKVSSNGQVRMFSDFGSRYWCPNLGDFKADDWEVI